MNPPVETELPRISKIDTDALETADTTGVGIRFENGAKVQVVEDEGGSVEKQWHGPDHLGEPDGTRVVDDATDPGWTAPKTCRSTRRRPATRSDVPGVRALRRREG